MLNSKYAYEVYIEQHAVCTCMGLNKTGDLHKVFWRIFALLDSWEYSYWCSQSYYRYFTRMCLRGLIYNKSVSRNHKLVPAHAMKTYTGSALYSNPCLTLDLHTEEWSTSSPGSFTLSEKPRYPLDRMGQGYCSRKGMDGPGIESRERRGCLYQSVSALRPTQPPIQWLSALFPRR